MSDLAYADGLVLLTNNYYEMQRLVEEAQFMLMLTALPSLQYTFSMLSESIGCARPRTQKHGSFH